MKTLFSAASRPCPSLDAGANPKPFDCPPPLPEPAVPPLAALAPESSTAQSGTLVPSASSVAHAGLGSIDFGAVLGFSLPGTWGFVVTPDVLDATPGPTLLTLPDPPAPKGLLAWGLEREADEDDCDGGTENTPPAKRLFPPDASGLARGAETLGSPRSARDDASPPVFVPSSVVCALVAAAGGAGAAGAVATALSEAGSAT